MIAAPIIPYLSGGREKCITGACLLFRGCDLLSRAIECFSEFSHCAPIVRMDEYLGSPDRVALIEALEHGLTPTLVSNRCSNYNGDVYLFIPDGLTPEIQDKFRQHMFMECLKGTPYNYEELIENIVHRTTENPAAQICSEAEDLGLQFAGLERIPEYKSNLTPRPGDIPVWWKGSLYRLLPPFVLAQTTIAS